MCARAVKYIPDYKILLPQIKVNWVVGETNKQYWHVSPNLPLFVSIESTIISVYITYLGEHRYNNTDLNLNKHTILGYCHVFI